VDKHSSGGVGDKVSLLLAPLVASCDTLHKVQVPMMAGRGLGHTGGTIDKLESFKGYSPSQSLQDFQRIVQDVGCAIVCANNEICPADQRLYALRDVTATVESLPLQTASIMSKKIAERADSIVLDVKHGNGAFQSTVQEAQALAESMVAVGEANGLCPTTAFLTDMNHPLGYAVGNWVEAKECIEIMKGNLKSTKHRLSWDLITLVVVQAGQMLHQGQTDGDHWDKKHSLERCMEHAYQVLDSGKALDKFRQMMLAQNADPEYLEKALDAPDDIPLAKFVATWTWEGTDKHESCYIKDIPAKTMGYICVMLGAGRSVAGQQVDAQAGLIFSKHVGDAVEKGEVIVKLFTNVSQELADEALQKVQASILIEPDPVPFPKTHVITHIVDSRNGVRPFTTPAFLQAAFLS
jgi:pyrimidine-nucleoside phosphorylase